MRGWNRLLIVAAILWLVHFSLAHLVYVRPVLADLERHPGGGSEEVVWGASAYIMMWPVSAWEKGGRSVDLPYSTHPGEAYASAAALNSAIVVGALLTAFSAAKGIQAIRRTAWKRWGM